jgi:hypothetical protein
MNLPIELVRLIFSFTGRFVLDKNDRLRSKICLSDFDNIKELLRFNQFISKDIFYVHRTRIVKIYFNYYYKKKEITNQS